MGLPTNVTPLSLRTPVQSAQVPPPTILWAGPVHPRSQTPDHHHQNAQTAVPVDTREPPERGLESDRTAYKDIRNRVLKQDLSGLRHTLNAFAQSNDSWESRKIGHIASDDPIRPIATEAPFSGLSGLPNGAANVKPLASTAFKEAVPPVTNLKVKAEQRHASDIKPQMVDNRVKHKALDQKGSLEASNLGDNKPDISRASPMIQIDRREPVPQTDISATFKGARTRKSPPCPDLKSPIRKAAKVVALSSPDSAVRPQVQPHITKHTEFCIPSIQGANKKNKNALEVIAEQSISTSPPSPNALDDNFGCDGKLPGFITCCAGRSDDIRSQGVPPSLMPV